jgi:hypothetical protein
VSSLEGLLIQTSPLSRVWENKCPHCGFVFLQFDGTEFQEVDSDLPDSLSLHDDIAYFKLGTHPWAQIRDVAQCLACGGFYLDLQLRTIFNPFKTPEKGLGDWVKLQEKANLKQARTTYFKVNSPLAASFLCPSSWLCIRIASGAGDGFFVEEGDLKGEIHVFPLLPIKCDPHIPLNLSCIYHSWIRRLIQRFYTPFQRIEAISSERVAL